MHDKITQKIAAVMNSLDGMQPAEPQPYLLTRLKARLECAPEQSTWSAITAFIKTPAVAFVSVLLLLLLNIAVFSAGGFFPGKKNISANNIPAKYDFTVNVSGIYDIENQEP
ncbi:MAG: hypothetical protein WKF88_03815 [Ferruginibacter sp.]